MRNQSEQPLDMIIIKFYSIQTSFSFQLLVDDRPTIYCSHDNYSPTGVLPLDLLKYGIAHLDLLYVWTPKLSAMFMIDCNMHDDM